MADIFFMIEKKKEKEKENIETLYKNTGQEPLGTPAGCVILCHNLPFIGLGCAQPECMWHQVKVQDLKVVKRKQVPQFFSGIWLVSNTNKILAKVMYCWLFQNHQLNTLDVLIVYDFLSAVQGRSQNFPPCSSSLRKILALSTDPASDSCSAHLHLKDAQWANGQLS